MSEKRQSTMDDVTDEAVESEFLSQPDLALAAHDDAVEREVSRVPLFDATVRERRQHLGRYVMLTVVSAALLCVVALVAPFVSR